MDGSKVRLFVIIMMCCVGRGYHYPLTVFIPCTVRKNASHSLSPLTACNGPFLLRGYAS